MKFCATNDVRFVVLEVTQHFRLIRNRHFLEFHPPLFWGGEREFLMSPTPAAFGHFLIYPIVFARSLEPSGDDCPNPPPLLLFTVSNHLVPLSCKKS